MQKSCIDITNQIFGRWMVSHYDGNAKWMCQCVCGTRRAVLSNALRHKKSQSCGCLRKDVEPFAKTHGGRYTPEYTLYHNARARCRNLNHPRYADYGGRGIEFRFNSFEEFYAEVGERPTDDIYTLDRIDNNGHYEKGNLRWATLQQQNQNTRMNHWITINGETHILEEWMRISPLNRSSIKSRIARGWCHPCSIMLPLFHLCPHVPHNANILAQKQTVLMPLD